MAPAKSASGIPTAFQCPLKVCVECGRKLTGGSHTMTAKCYDLTGVTDVEVVHKRCCRRACRTWHGFNYCIVNTKKVNFAEPSALDSESVLFISNNRCFTVRYLKSHANLMFRGPLAAQAQAWSYFDLQGKKAQAWDSKFDADVSFHFQEQHFNALMYYVALTELAPLELHREIVVEDEISAGALASYDKRVHQFVYPPADANDVTELVGDGHAKVLVKCGGSPKRASRPKKTKN